MTLFEFRVNTKFNAVKSIIDLCDGVTIHGYSSNVSESIGNICFYDLEYIVYIKK